jgi:flavin reductase (DIM6/NTAB) family NADH-FMN oxidoreductase RutF
MSLDQISSQEGTEADPVGVDPLLLRSVSGTFATGITVITCAIDGTPHGCAANAVLSVSLKPPLMLISLAETSRTKAAIEIAGHFAINMLPDNDNGSVICSIFAGRSEDKFSWIPHRFGRLGAPLLRDALGFIECSVESAQVAGDHTIFIGRVVDAAHEPGEPIVFFRGRNRRLAA